MKNKDRITYTLKHRKAFRQVEKQLLGHNTIRSLFHDLDKVILYNFFDYKAVHNFHRKHTRHHELKAHTHNDYVQMVYMKKTVPWQRKGSRKLRNGKFRNCRKPLIPV